MPTNVVDLVKTEYRLISDKTSFIARLIEGNCTVRADTSVPVVGSVGMPLDPSIALIRQFDGNVYGKAVGETAKVVVLESNT